MINKLKLQDVLAAYKKNFAENGWTDEKYKWEAIKCFQDNWDINATDFLEMLKKSFSKTTILLATTSYFPKKMIEIYAESYTEDVRHMYIDLYDESKDLYERVQAFKKNADSLNKKHEDGKWNHYQNESAIFTYLWLRYPDKYYIYKLSQIKATAKELESNYTFKKGAYAENIRNFMLLYDEVNNELQQDNELKELLNSKIDDNCYRDPYLKTMTIDIAYFISSIYSKEPNEDEKKPEIDLTTTWWPIDYTPGLTVEEWVGLLNDKEVFDTKSLEVMKRMLDYGGSAACVELSEKYGEGKSFYIAISVKLAQRIVKKTGCPVLLEDNEYSKWWPVLYVGRRPSKSKSEKGTYIWRLRDELKEALQQVDLTEISLYAKKKALEKYSKEDFLNEVFMSEDKYERLVSVLKKKKNIILQGAPGVGKTFAAKRLAYSIMGEKDENRIKLVQFHQNYSYEDFIMGYKPEGDSFVLKYGVFYKFCQEATDNHEQDYFFIIDEINRGNMSKIFGELLMLIEKDYRGTSVTLAYDGKSFSVPENVYIIGMMNTADRSLAMIDYALRRRFSFFEMAPGFESDGFTKYKNGINDDTFDELVSNIIELNKEIENDKSLGRGFLIGHSYLCGIKRCTTEMLRDIVDYDILPMLSEYWFDDNEKLVYWQNKFNGIFQ